MLRVVYASENNPYYNLAMEESLFRSVENNEDIILYLWQNDNTVVIGRNQNVYTECNLSYVESNHAFVARRLTGGGAVYHDLGNVNFTIITPRKYYDISRTSQMIARAICNCGICAEVSGRNDILANGQKFSGNAFYSTEMAGMHHGTIMVDVDLTVMNHMLSTSKGKINRKGIKSVRSRVVNLQEIKPDVTCITVEQAIEQEFIREYAEHGGLQHGASEEECRMADKMYDKYSSKEWNYNQLKEYAVRNQKQFPWGYVELMLELDGTEIVGGSLNSDCLFPDIIDELRTNINAKEKDVFKSLKGNLEAESIESRIVEDLEELYDEIIVSIQN